MNQFGGIHGGAEVTPLSGVRVLLVEDTWIIAQSYAGLLEPLGVTILGPASRLGDAQKLLAESEIDAALVDMNLHGEMADPLIAALNERNVPTVVVTGYEVVPQLAERTAAVLKKPIRAEQLLKVLRGIIARATADRKALAEARG